MPIRIPTPLIEFILLGSTEDRRQLQDSPILGDVWLAFGKSPSGRLDLLISPYMTRHAGEVADTIRIGLAKKYKNATNEKNKVADIAYLQGLVAANLSFQDALEVVVPKTKWWIDKWVEQIPKNRKKVNIARSKTKKASKPTFAHESITRYQRSKDRDILKQMLAAIFGSAKAWHRSLLQEEEDEEEEATEQRSRAGERGSQDKPVDLVPFDRLAALTGLILWAGKHKRKSTSRSDNTTYILETISTKREVERIATLLRTSLKSMREGNKEKADPLIWQISLNRDALPALVRSVPAVKADAATTLFKVNCSEIGWAVLDSGIDGRHPAFETRGGNPERETLEKLFRARGNDDYTIHLTYPIDRIDKARRDDWEKEQRKERNRKKKNSKQKVRGDWKASKHSLREFFKKNPGLEKKIKIVDPKQNHAIDLLDPIKF